MAKSMLDRETIEMMAMNMEYIRLGLEKNAGNFSKAQWLYFLIKSYKEDIDAQHRANATAERKRLNGKGYAGKADH